MLYNAVCQRQFYVFVIYDAVYIADGAAKIIANIESMFYKP